jgi:hypothetical protein
MPKWRNHHLSLSLSLSLSQSVNEQCHWMNSTKKGEEEEEEKDSNLSKENRSIKSPNKISKARTEPNMQRNIRGKQASKEEKGSFKFMCLPLQKKYPQGPMIDALLPSPELHPYLQRGKLKRR